MPSVRQQRGTAAEDWAADFLRQKNFEILGQHITSRFGEIDILAKDHDIVVAIEVKARNSDAFGPAIESVTPKKMTSISQTLDWYCQQQGWMDVPRRIDVITIDKNNQVEHHLGVE